MNNAENLLTLINKEFELEKEELQEIEEQIETLNFDGYDYIDIDWGEYRVIADNQIEDLYYDSIKELVEECYLWNSDLPSFITNNIDWDWIVKECMYDWYWHHFNWYDGWEIEGEGFYLFRNN